MTIARLRGRRVDKEYKAENNLNTYFVIAVITILIGIYFSVQLARKSTAVTASLPAESRAIVLDDLKAYIEHIDERFAILNEKLSNSTIDGVIIAGNSKNNEHALGTGLAIGQWKDRYGEERGTEYNMIIRKHITDKIEQLKKNHAGKIQLGPVGLTPPNGTWEYGRPSHSASKKIYHLWGANSSNFNLGKGENIFGGGQAEYFPKQQSGVFGVVTTPLNGPPTEPSIDNYS